MATLSRPRRAVPSATRLASTFSPPRLSCWKDTCTSYQVKHVLLNCAQRTVVDASALLTCVQAQQEGAAACSFLLALRVFSLSRFPSPFMR